MRLGTRLECIGSSPRVSGACQDGIREFVGRRPRLAGRLSGVAERLAGSLIMTMKKSYISDMDPGSSLGVGLRFDDAVRAHREFARTSSNVSGKSLETCREIIGGRPPDSPQGMSEVAELWE
ncbi:hypothetical protein B296_00040961 [Ensete ventricosum]|uniref:Uncharacterized protein n=1 Tax=Ensete ventricosum TaxID=4639 RepID=A0A426Y791_ENSVE|nr:hypothetical protein B296_00040961 [Ensete ventricosum]